MVWLDGRLEKRRPRFALRTAVLFRRFDEQAWHCGETTDLSGGGACFDATAQALEPGRSLHLVIQLAHANGAPAARIACRARVVRTCSSVAGVGTMRVAVTIIRNRLLPPPDVRRRSTRRHAPHSDGGTGSHENAGSTDTGAYYECVAWNGRRRDSRLRRKLCRQFDS